MSDNYIASVTSSGVSFQGGIADAIWVPIDRPVYSVDMYSMPEVTYKCLVCETSSDNLICSKCKSAIKHYILETRFEEMIGEEYAELLETELWETKSYRPDYGNMGWSRYIRNNSYAKSRSYESTIPVSYLQCYDRQNYM